MPTPDKPHPATCFECTAKDLCAERPCARNMRKDGKPWRREDYPNWPNWQD